MVKATFTISKILGWPKLPPLQGFYKKLLHCFCRKTAWSAEWDDLYKQKAMMFSNQAEISGANGLQVNQVSAGKVGLQSLPALNSEKTMVCLSHKPRSNTTPENHIHMLFLNGASEVNQIF